MKVKGSFTTEALSSFEYGGGVTIIREAKRKSEEKLLKKIRGFDLLACEENTTKAVERNMIRSLKNGAVSQTNLKCYRINWKRHMIKHSVMCVNLRQ